MTSQPKTTPFRLAPLFDNIPEELRALPQWVCWKYQPDPDGGKPKKVPYDPKDCGYASSTNPATWDTFEKARQTFKADDGLAGIGFVFTKDDPYAGIDIDHCLDRGGVPNETAYRLLSLFDSYSEKSPSQTGLHIIVKCGKELPGKKKDEIEVYTHSRYFTFTGRTSAKRTKIINDHEQTLVDFYDEFFLGRGTRTRENPQAYEWVSGKKYGLAALRGELDKLRRANEGERNATLNEVSFSLGQLIAGGELANQGDVEDAIKEVAAEIGLGDAETIATMRSGISAGLLKPRKAPDRKKEEDESESADPLDGIDFMDFRISRYLDAPPPPVDYVITGLPVGCVGGIIAPPGAGKTHFAQAIAGAVATGQADVADNIFDVPKQGRVLVISAEDREWAVHDRIWRGFGNVFDPFDAEEAERAAQIKADLRENMIVFPAKGLDLSLIAQGQSGWTSTKGYDSLLARVQKVPDLRLIVLDPLARFFTANENDNPAGTYFCVLLERIAKATGSAILINHHTNKGSCRPGKEFNLESALHQDAARGASALTGAWDWQYNLCPLPGKFASGRLGVQARDEEYLAGRASKVRFGQKSDVTFFRAGEEGMLIHLEDKFVKEKMSTNVVLRKRIIEEVRRKEEAGEKRISITTLARTFASEWKEEGATVEGLKAVAKIMVSDGALKLVTEKQGHKASDYLALGEVDPEDEETREET